MVDVYICIGSNIDKDTHIPACLAALESAFGTLKASGIYESEPFGFSGDNFYNMVVCVQTDMRLKDIGQLLRKIENERGRIRNGLKFSSHTLDLDVILYGNLISEQDGMHIPRKGIEHYAFVLEPLAELAGDMQHPVTSVRFKTIWENFNKTGVRQQKVTPVWSCR